MRDAQSDLQSRGANLLAIGLGDMHYARLFRERNEIRFPLLVDEQRVAYQAIRLRSANLFHLLRKDNARARHRARKEGFRQHRLGKDPFQLGASFVFGPGNVDHFVHLSETFGDNAAIDKLIDALHTSARK